MQGDGRERVVFSVEANEGDLTRWWPGATGKKAAIEGVIADMVFDFEPRGQPAVNTGNASPTHSVTRDEPIEDI